jgi:4-diphosphocytidyl-2-C-methyl-D-erythritol kinase
MSEITRLCPAKINLTLRVVGRRPDGFHEIESLVARVGLFDTVRVAPRDDGQFALRCDDPSVPCDESNLAQRAARQLAQVAGRVDRGVDITLQKRIPPASGLGGGSSNAAITLMLLNDLWQLGLSKPELAGVGSEIGSDVPLFFHTPLCVIRGRGEHVEDVPRSLSGWITLVLPEVRSETAEVYAAWDQMQAHPPRPSIDEILRHVDRAEMLAPHVFNDLEEPARAVNPRLAQLAESLERLSGGSAWMTGSGSAFCRLFDERTNARRFARRVADELGLRTEVVSLLS